MGIDYKSACLIEKDAIFELFCGNNWQQTNINTVAFGVVLLLVFTVITITVIRYFNKIKVKKNNNIQ